MSKTLISGYQNQRPSAAAIAGVMNARTIGVSIFTVVTSTALWMYVQSSASVIAASEAEPELADISFNFDTENFGTDPETMPARLIVGTQAMRRS
ncbi:hypothetical protein UI24_23290 [Mycobacteroides franklinii]|nr:hypothetical protein [Mycobacteroides franklinii]